ncbi:MAG: GNAT family N-acetyltransferase [Anaerolineae bacterium]|nr:GNAT family N-acetyltransferase [Anaerolineae bacterium]
MNEPVTIRRAIPDDAPAIARHRRLMFETMGHTNPALLDTMEAAFVPWVRERLASEIYLGWLAITGAGFAASGAGLWVREYPPNPIDMGFRRGYVLNVYTYPAYRRRGLARQLVKCAVVWCQEQNINGVMLHYTEAGRQIYESLGFRLGNEMFMWTKNLQSGDEHET